MSTTKQRSLKDIPEFDSYEEEANFWDSVDFADFGDELEPIEVEPFDGPIGHILSVRLESKDFRRLTRLARARDVSFITLAETWVREALDRAEVADASATPRDATAG